WALFGPKGYASVDYLAWWYTPMRAVPLIQSVPGDHVVNPLPAGVASTYFPAGNRISFNKSDGVRLNAGVNWDHWGLDFSGFVLERRTKAASLFSTGAPIAVGQPYISTSTGEHTILYAS